MDFSPEGAGLSFATGLASAGVSIDRQKAAGGEGLSDLVVGVFPGMHFGGLETREVCEAINEATQGSFLRFSIERGSLGAIDSQMVRRAKELSTITLGVVTRYVVRGDSGDPSRTDLFPFIVARRQRTPYNCSQKRREVATFVALPSAGYVV